MCATYTVATISGHQDEKKKKSQRRTGKQRITPTVFPRVSLFERFFLFSLCFQIFLDLHPFFVDFTLLHLKKIFLKKSFKLKKIFQSVSR